MLKDISAVFTKNKFNALLVCIIALFISVPDFLTSLKPQKNYDDVMTGNIKAGDRVNADIELALGMFASYGENKYKAEKVYYIIPTDESFCAIKVDSQDESRLDTLTDETVDYILEIGEYPTSIYKLEGIVEKIKDNDVLKYYKESLVEMGITNEAFNNMEHLIISQRLFGTDYMFFAIGIIGIILVVLVTIKDVKNLRAARRSYDFLDEGSV